jgi:hypothetical protein
MFTCISFLYLQYVPISMKRWKRYETIMQSTGISVFQRIEHRVRQQATLAFSGTNVSYRFTTLHAGRSGGRPDDVGPSPGLLGLGASALGDRFHLIHGQGLQPAQVLAPAS